MLRAIPYCNDQSNRVDSKEPRVGDKTFKVCERNHWTVVRRKMRPPYDEAPSERSRLLPLAQVEESRGSPKEENANKKLVSFRRPVIFLSVVLCTAVTTGVISIVASSDPPSASSSQNIEPLPQSPPREAILDNVHLIKTWQEWQTNIQAKVKGAETDVQSKMHNSWNATPIAHANASAFKQQVGKDLGAVQNSINNSITAIEESETIHQTENWFMHAWGATKQDAHSFWLKLTNGSQTLKEHEATWWGKTVHTEHEWYNHTLLQMHAFGTHIKSWWNHTEDAAGQEERVLQEKFQHWWQEASVKERQWWNDTVDASQRFETVTEDKTQLWWHMTRETTAKGWNHTVDQEQRWWNKTQIWFHDHRADPHPLNLPPVYMNNSRAYSWLMNGYGWYDHSGDYFLYQMGLDVQINDAYCAVATAASVLNSFRPLLLDALPQDPLYDGYPYATQASLLQNGCVNNTVIHYNETYDGLFHTPGGLTLKQVQRLLQCHIPSSWNVTLVHVEPSAVGVHNTVRREFKKALTDPNSRVLINYDRQKLGQEGGGHFSPVGSYSEQEDSFLILDVAKYKYPAVWVRTPQLVSAMGSTDNCGVWDYPAAQEMLGSHKPTTAKKYEREMAKLGCEPALRGYIVVTAGD